jgi:hypothetical protein
VEKAIPVFEKLHPGAVAVFAFDNSSSHGAFAADALNARAMNVNPGGKQPIMRDTIFNEQVQHMVFPDNYPDPSLRGKPKGMRFVLQERQLWKEGMIGFCNKNPPASPSCCMRHVLEQQPDFANQKCSLQEVIETHGHKIIFYPKFHCELNYIEMYWGAVKKYTRNKCDYTWSGLQKVVPTALDTVSVKQIRKYARRSFRYMDAYQKGLDIKQAEYAVKKYKRHRKIPYSILDEL